MIRGIVQAAAGYLRAPLRRIRERPDTEFEQAVIRVVILFLLYAYFHYLFVSGRLDLDPAVLRQMLHLIGPGVIGFSLLLLFLVARDPGISPVRRLVGATVDLSACTWVLLVSHEAGTIVIAAYLWVTLGNGFRYGVPYLVYSAVLSIAGFSAVMAFSPFWAEHPGLGAGMLLMLVLIPLYTGFLIRKLHRAVGQAQEASRAKSAFLANMSHELRTPLNGVIGLADLMRETPLNREQTELTQAIQTSAMALHRLIENVLDIARIEAGKIMVVEEDYDLHQLLNSLVVMLEPQAHRKGVRLSVHVSPGTPYSLYGDVQHLRQVLINLLGNAIKFTENGRVDVSVRRLERPGSWLRFEVEDTGIGIAAEKQDSVFDVFVQADESITRRYGGTGLGASISRQLVEMMGGRIGLRSALGEGSTFWFEVPVRERDAVPEELPGALKVGVFAGGELGARLAELVRNWHGEVVPVRAPLPAMQEWRERPWLAPDALLLERRLLPEDPGRFIESLRNNPEFGRYPVILVDSDPSGSRDLEWTHAGFSAVLHTPVNPTLLFNALHEAAFSRPLPENVVSLSEHFQAKAGRTRLCILVAEDNPVNRMVLCGLLERAGHEVIAAVDGEEALDLLEAHAGRLHLAIMDVHMPRLSGPEAVRRWRFMEDQRLPIIMLTADARVEAERECMEAGADDFLTKPVDSRRLLEKVAKWTAPRRGGAAKSRQTDAPDGTVLDESVFKDLADFGGGMAFVRQLIDEFRQDSERALDSARNALDQRDHAAWREYLHMLKGGASDVGALAMAQVCADGERIKPFEIGQPLARKHLAGVVEARRAVLAAMQEYLDRQSSARG